MPRVKQVLIRAAKLIDSGERLFCCPAIRQAANFRYGDPWYSGTGHAAHDAEMHFFRLFCPVLQKTKEGASFWNKKPTTERQQWRVLALLFAAASYDEKRDSTPRY